MSRTDEAADSETSVRCIHLIVYLIDSQYFKYLGVVLFARFLRVLYIFLLYCYTTAHTIPF